ncbi:hypothetical protein ACJIZ3_016542 [Penstemon smallii]|uniref:WD repeat-containing protein 6 n=1 Tax=Penstemon smallii TaxID=265156 RepID=A0ABD3STQ5_9LAMI
MSASWELRRRQYLGEISALCFLHLPPHLSSIPLLLAGTGSQILVYDLDSGKNIRSFQVFDGIRVHGITLEPFNKQVLGSTLAFRIAVYGERRVKLFTLHVESLLNMELTLIHSLPKFGHWVLDICFLKEGDTSWEDACYLAVGCSDNVVYFWDIVRYTMFSEVKCSVRCLLYSMRMFGNEVESLRIASGTIFNEIVVWKVAHQDHAAIPGIHVEDHVQQTINDDVMLPSSKYKDVHISRLIGHEGSIFSIAWFSSGLKLVSVSDDRSARIWEVQPEKEGSTKTLPDMVNHLTGPVLFGHNARIWDCCISDSLIITAGEDCTCRVWDQDGRELKEIKEHIGRGVWRCLYDPSSSLIVTAGFDSAIKVHQFLTSSKGIERIVASGDLGNRKEVFALSLPNSPGHGGLMDSKSEYVRCLHFSREDSLYVATNNGYLYHAGLFKNGVVKWTKLARISTAAPIICMDLLSKCSDDFGRFEDCVAVGDGKGSLTVIQIVGSGSTPKIEYTLTWSAEKERHLLGTYWCKSLDNRFIFTADPGGRLKLWKLSHNSPSASLIGRGDYDSFLIAEYASCFGMRIMCVDASFNKELLVCGDIRGNLLLFPLPKDLLCGTSVAAEVEASPPLNYFKGAHGVSSVCSVSIAGLCSDQDEIRSTGTDGCICYLQHDRDQLNLEFVGMKQVKELSAIRSVFSTAEHSDVGNYAVGFASENFIIWNITSETKVIQITCGGWRRPHSYYLGDSPEVMSCFSFVKNDVIYIHRQWVPENDRQIYPRNLHFQFHGREIHSLCFIYGNSLCNSDENKGLNSGSSWIATGCEDGTVRLTRYEPGIENWSSSKLLGEHVGGSAVRSICSVSKIYTFTPDSIGMPNGTHEQKGTLEDRGNPNIIISVGAKRVVTAWKQMIRMSNGRLDAQCSEIDNGNENYIIRSSSTAVSSLSFQWLTTDMPSKNTNYVNRQNTKEVLDRSVDLSTNSSVATIGSHSSKSRNMGSNFYLEDNTENDWRYLDVTSFLVKDAGSRISTCFVIVACSDATVILRALVLPFRLWFDVASLAPLSSPVLALQHVVIPKLLPSTGNMDIGNLYLVITGSTDGNIAFWDLTECVENFMQRIYGLQMESYMDFQKRPRTGRGSQGGRWWRSINGPCAKKKPGEGRLHKDCVFNENNNTDLVSVGSTGSGSEMENHVNETSEKSKDDSSPETTILKAVHVLNTVHQSGVNCLHVPDVKDLRQPDSQFSFFVVSGGDDQAINCIRCDLEINPTTENTQKMTTKIHYNHRCLIKNHQIQFLYLDKITSAHSSAVKGIWTDGIWVFSVGLDQRVRCWNLGHDRLTEYAHLIISVPEPEALDVKVCGRNHYQIAVAGRGMQMVDFFPSSGT